MLVHACLTPHPPIMVSEVGGEDVQHVHASIQALEILSKNFVETQPEIVFLISPHSLLLADRFVLSCSKNLQGNLGSFGAPQVQQSFKGALSLQESIVKELATAFPAQIYEPAELDHASMVPLYFLSKHYKKFELLIAGFSYLSLREHFKYGQALGKVFKDYDKKIALVASGDLSHRLTPDAPAGFDAKGQEFDDKLIKLLAENDVEGILNLDENLTEHAGECGLRSIVIALGILSNFNYSFKKLSYEGPFGVGYLVGEWKLKARS
ncbi:MAG: AmmeMemoRadiSam system protein B [Candidatus Gracilibacteria bacterium]|nr:AmmeMemoRadiSam system protein B [Candidatus Gracilibacteria bacterium]